MKMMLSKKERDAIQTRLNHLTNAPDAGGDAGSIASEWVASLLAHAEAADDEMARLAAALEHEKALRERAEKGMDFFASGDWSI